MFTAANRFGFIAITFGALFTLVPTTWGGQIKIGGGPQRLFPINPNPQIVPGVTMTQFSNNSAVLGKAYNQIPPYLLGYNPYGLGNNFGPFYNPQVFQPAVYNPFNPGLYANVVPPYAGGYGQLGGNPYAGGYSAGGIDPLTGMPIGGAGGGYSAATNNPYYWNPYSGGYNYGTAMEIQAWGQLGLNQEQARILREQANQAKLDTRKKLVDTLAYIRANEYTFTQEQADIAKRLLKRVQETPTASEVNAGKSLNVLLADLVKFNDKHVSGRTVTLDEEVLKLINISGPGSSGNVGLLRDGGRFTWTAVFDNKIVVTEKERKDIELEAQQLYRQAANGKLDPNTLKDLESSLRTLRSNLTKQVNAVPTASYLAGQRFLDDFDAAVIGLKIGDVPLNLDFQQKFVKGPKTIQELVEYLGSRGLRFAAACPGDERAYTAMQAALAAYSVAIHSEVTTTASKGG